MEKHGQLHEATRKREQAVYDRLSLAYREWTKDEQLSKQRMTANALSKRAGVDRGWVKNPFHEKILELMARFNEDLAGKGRVARRSKGASAGVDDQVQRLRQELEQVRQDRNRLLQQRAFDQIEVDHWRDVSRKTEQKCSRLTEEKSDLLKQLAQRPVALRGGDDHYL